jgi:PadR family transcriptional regulator PadR
MMTLLYSLTAPLLDACVLGVLAQGDSYGYALTQQVRAVVDISESTLYPVLRRMQKEGQLETYDRPYQGRNRRYYRITPAGTAALEIYRNAWRDYRAGIDELIGGEDA